MTKQERREQRARTAQMKVAIGTMSDSIDADKAASKQLKGVPRAQARVALAERRVELERMNLALEETMQVSETPVAPVAPPAPELSLAPAAQPPPAEAPPARSRRPGASKQV